ncbi:MAG: hypothetical protein OEW45_05410 [Deltaproteobacteria bacterium]|nr:hypothetical protein [Deltaproteobacteria bacterium]
MVIMSLPHHSPAGEKGLATFESMTNNKEKKGKTTLVITQSFASRSLWLGDTWKVYLNASDPDGNMKYIVCTINQPGIGTSPASFTRIKEENRQELSGYIYLNTGGGYGLDLSSITLTVQIQDRSGNFSDSVSFPLQFQPGVRQEAPPQDTFQEIELGPIMITLQSTSGGGQ